LSTSTDSFFNRPTAEIINKKLSEALKPTELDIQDQSHLHKGHSGAPKTGESHFYILIVSPLFEGKTRVSRQKHVFDILKDELKEKIHALSLKTLTPEEFNSLKF
tara:strand:+ start:65 stop:379 length:315 start_codon:yes stop_codon:yes gene_type:complete